MMRQLQILSVTVLFVLTIGLAACAHRGAPPRAQACGSAPAALAESVRHPVFEGKQYVVFGELHGTKEIPEAFAAFVCEFAKREPLDVGIEWPEAYHDALNAYISGDAGEDGSVVQKITQEISIGGFTDGRSSQAFADMIETFRALKAGGADIVIVPFVPDMTEEIAHGSQTVYEKALAAELQKRRDLKRRTLVLVGDLHARKDVMRVDAETVIEHMASHLPAAEVLSIYVRRSGGTAWNCTSEGCCSHAVHEHNYAGKPAFEVHSVPKNGYEAAWLVGRVSASPPAGANVDSSASELKCHPLSHRPGQPITE